VPEHIRGPFSDPSRGDSEQPILDALARVEARQGRVEAQLESLARSVAELAARETSRTEAEAQAEAILRRAAAPGPVTHRVQPRKRRGETFLRVVQVVLVAVLGVYAVLALMAPRHLREQRYTPGTTVQVAHVHNDHDADDR
jgi:hypothetical protein